MRCMQNAWRPIWIVAACGAGLCLVSGAIGAGNEGPLDQDAIPTSRPPLYVVSMMHAEAHPVFMSNRHVLRTHARGLRRLTRVFLDHGAKLAFQPDWTFVEGARKWDPGLFEWLLAQGMGVDSHTHGNQFTVEEVAEQIRDLVADPVDWRVRVGNGDFDRPRPRGMNFLWPFCQPWQDAVKPYLEAAVAYKNPATQDSDAAGIAWRPALFGDWHVHQPDTPIVYIGGGPLGPLRDDFTVLGQALEISRRHTRPGCINVLYWHDSLHQYSPPAVIEQRVEWWDEELTKTFDPLAAAGVIRWATFSEMLDAYLALEATPAFALQPGELIEEIDDPLDTPTTLAPLHP